MECKQFQNLIASDYIDGEADARLRERIERHLEKCGRCREFEQALRRAAVEPLRSSERISPPESVWSNIKGKIEKKEVVRDEVRWVDSLRDIFAIRKPALALAVVMMCIVITAIFARPHRVNREDVSSYLQSQVKYVFLMGDNGNGYMDTGTAIEEYFM